MGHKIADKLNRIQNMELIPLPNTKYPETVKEKEKITVYTELNLDEERALYGIHNARISNCIFDGPLDAESALKESENISVSDCDFRLCYPFRHIKKARIDYNRMTETCRAAIGYGKHMTIKPQRCPLGAPGETDENKFFM